MKNIKKKKILKFLKKNKKTSEPPWTPSGKNSKT